VNVLLPLPKKTRKKKDAEPLRTQQDEEKEADEPKEEG
jgi:hypothetical protein